MTASGLHVVFGTGQVGRALAAHLASSDRAVRAVSLNRPGALAAGVDWRAADATDAEAASHAAKGASAIYQCLNARYTQWPQRFPPLQRGVLAAAERSGALLVSLENVYGYGPIGGRPMTEDLPLAATGHGAAGPGPPPAPASVSRSVTGLHYPPDRASGTPAPTKFARQNALPE